MAIKDKLDAAWADNLMQDATFEVRAVMQNGYNQLSETVAMIDAIIARAVFAGVDSEIKTKGQAIRTIFNSAKNALDGHTDFLNWTQS